MKKRYFIAAMYILVCMGLNLQSSSSLASQVNYNPAKVVYDVSSSDPVALGHILDRINMLQNVYNNDTFEASIIVVIHEEAIPLFKAGGQPELMRRARSLALGEIIEFKVCEASARMQKITAAQLHDFISMIPMADAEIVRLQHSGYAYLR